MIGFSVIIPARLASTRLPEKALADLGGKPMVVRVAERARLSRAEQVVVAADHPRIQAACAEHGIDCILTGEQPSGTARLAEAAALLRLPPERIIINVQGDEPLMPPALINRLADTLAAGSAPMATAAHPIADRADFDNPNCVKVVADNNGNALYFSRAPIPFPRDTPDSLPEPPPLRHIGLYAYRTAFLQDYVRLPESPLEHTESLEQLRVLWHGGRIALCLCGEAPPAGVDTAADLQRIRHHFAHA